METSILENIGFTKGEIRIYLALLELGETTTGSIIDKSRISSSKVYEILEKLIQKGLVSYITKGKTKFFQALPPSKIKEYLINKKKEFEKNEKKAIDMINILQKKQNISSEPQSTAIYEGLEGIKTFFMLILDSLKKGEEYYVFSMDEESTSKELHNFFLNYHVKRVSKGIKVKLISRKELKKDITTKFPEYKLSQRRFISGGFLPGIVIFKNHVMHFQYSPKMTLIVTKSNTLYENYKKFFLELWKEAKS